MRLLIVGSVGGKIAEAGKIAFSRGAEVTHREDIMGALDALRTGDGADLIMADLRLDIARLVKDLEAERIAVPVVACGIGNNAEEAVKAIKDGAKEYIPLPPNEELIAAILEAATQETSDIIFKDPVTKKTVDLAKQFAPSDASVLITGESGTGKEVFARFIHNNSKRAKKKFISLNCAAIPENLLESELFGHEKGAFTGAVARRIGKFEEANGGTLLLDEISEMQLNLQAKLLRAIQERVIERVGGNAPVKVDIRVIATSNRDLQKTVKAGEFREDLYFRLNVVNLQLPALRDRPGDIDALAPFFGEKYGKENGISNVSITPEALAKLKKHTWPGNVRELENTMHRAVLLSSQGIIDENAIMLTPDHNASEEPVEAASTNQDTSGQSNVGTTVADMERQLILSTLDHCIGNRTHAAKILGISIRTLRNKLNQYSEEGFDVAGADGAVDGSRSGNG